MVSLGPFSRLLLFATAALAVPADFGKRAAAPTVTLDQGTFTGKTDGSTNKFLGIPFGKPPVGNLRFNLPQAVDAYNGTYDATSFGPACPQQAFDFPEFSGLTQTAVDLIFNAGFNAINGPAAEDCLSLNVFVPAGTKPGAKLPVLAWIFGGGFEIGGSSLYDGKLIVDQSIDLSEPIIYVSMNYRVSAYGFLAGKEVRDAGVGNLGLQDQRLALRWIQKYISTFGGDPSKVTIWGVSSGAISVALQMVTNGGDTEGLFSGAFMQSGSPTPVGPIEHGQDDYDSLVAQTNCTSAADTLQCLREVPYDTLKAVVDKTAGFFSAQSLRLAWQPRVDGKFLTDVPQNLVKAGSVANIPFVSGDSDDEGTLFSLSTLNMTTESELRDYILNNYMPAATYDDVDELLAVYPQDVTQGSPYNTSIFNAMTPVYKQLAALQGDLVFQAPRRYFLQTRADKQPIWSYLNKRLKLLPMLGAFHASDLLIMYGQGDLCDYLINFVNNGDPNGKTGITWPQYSVASPKLLTLHDGFTPLTITNDDYRIAAMAKMTELSFKFPI